MHLVGFIIRIYHDARSPESQVLILNCIPVTTITTDLRFLTTDLRFLRLAHKGRTGFSLNSCNKSRLFITINIFSRTLF